MKRSSKNPALFFWSIVTLVVTIVASVTAGTYFQYKMTAAVPETADSLGVAYQVASSAKAVWCLVINFF